MSTRGGPGYREVAADVAERANRHDWDANADDYQAEHGGFLGDVGFIWCPEGVDEADARLLGDVTGARALEVGSGAAQCARWLRERGCDAVALDLSYRQLQHSHRIDDESGVAVPSIQATASTLPFAAGSFDIAFSAFGALSFVVDIGAALREVRRVLRPGGHFVFSVVHPSRWMFPDDPTKRGLTVSRSYFDRTPYVESDRAGNPTYVEPHHTMADWTNAIRHAGMSLESALEPEWPADHDRVWGGWGPERGGLVPGTLILSVRVS